MLLGYFTEEAYEKLLHDIPNNAERYSEIEDWLPTYFGSTTDYYKMSTVDVNKFVPDYTPGKKDDEQKSQEDLVNTRLIHSAFRNLTPLQASNKYMWTYLCHAVPEYRDYIRDRWMQKEQNNNINRTIINRFFVTIPSSLLNDNALSRLWWYGYLTYDPQNRNPYALTEILFTNQTICTDVMDTLNRMNLNRMRGVLLAIRDFKNEISDSEGITEYFRKCKKYLNHYAAVTAMEFLEPEEIRDLAFNYMIRLREEKLAGNGGPKSKKKKKRNDEISDRKCHQWRVISAVGGKVRSNHGGACMAVGRSFAEYIKEICYNGLFEASEQYVEINWNSMNLYTRNVHKIGTVELVDVTIQRVYIQDLPDMRLAFDVGLELELMITEGDYHYDNYDQNFPWLRVSCEGDLTDGLGSWTIKGIEPYNPKSASQNSLSDALVPYIPYNRLETEAQAFLQEFYPEALKITPHGQPPIPIDPTVLAERMELTIRMQRIREDASVFGQIYFEEKETEMFDADKGQAVLMCIPARTIVVDPLIYLLRNIGCVNNTIVHECVHWVKHRKAFELEKLFNADASNISCEVVGGAASKIAKSATEQMEKQANQLTPRIQMPAEPFRAKAREYIARLMRESGANHENEVMEQVITALQIDYLVSKQAAKIRMVELGFDIAIGTYTYLDNHYVKPHGFRKGTLKVNQTFSISAQDAAIERLVNHELRQLTENGDYLFIDNHYVYNAPLYVQPDEDGRLDLTDYARAHMDECCLVVNVNEFSYH